MVSAQTHVVSAKDYHGPENLHAAEAYQAEDAQIGSAKKKAEAPQLNRQAPAVRYAEEIGKNTTEKMQAAAMAADAAAADTSSQVYYGVLSGYLAQAKDTKIYTVNLNAGEYFQAKLTPPADSKIDYDLLLYDSSLTFIKSCDYVTCTTSEMATLEESIGYLAKKAETVYACVYSAAGGSNTQAYKMEYTITTNFTDAGEEPDENVKEASALTLGKSVAKVSGKIHTPLDNDWYSFTVADDPAYDVVRLNITSSSTSNGCRFEIYQDLSSGYNAMFRVTAGKSGEIDLPAGAYYVRVVSTNTFDNFNAGEIPVYNLSVCQATRVDKITLYELNGHNGTRDIHYPEGTYYRIDEWDKAPNVVKVSGVAHYIDEDGNEQPAVNARITCEILDEQWAAINRPDMATVYGSAITRSNGVFEMTVYLNSALGGLRYFVTVSTHYYDLMDVKVTSGSNENASAEKKFYYLKYCDII